MINISDMYFKETMDKILMDISACTVSPWQEAMGLVTEGGLSGEFISNAFRITGYSLVAEAQRSDFV